MDTRDKILRAAVQLFQEKGFHQSTIQEIGERAGVSKGAVFHYYPTKTELLFATNSLVIDSEIEHFNEVLSNNELSPPDKLCKLVTYLVQNHADKMPEVIVFYQELRNLPKEQLEIIKRGRDNYEEVFKKIVLEGIEKGYFKEDLNVNIVTKGIFGMCLWTYQWMNPSGPMTASQIAKVFCDVLIDGLRKK